MTAVHALLVGINEYVNIPPLHGCVNDVSAIESVLTARIGPALKVHKLLDAQATRAAIIDGFRTFLSQAAPNDIALFYFCGHGSREKCPDEWAYLEPSGMNQTIVPVDARANGVFDIADKEMATLIDDVAATGAQVITIFDSCHSGGATRDLGDDELSRMASPTDARRTLRDYLPRAVELYDPKRVAEQGAPAPSHIAFAACQHFETAKEVPRKPPRRGTFTRSLEEVLQTLGPSATYLDVVRAVSTKVRYRAEQQRPLLTVTGKADPSTLFLGGTTGRRDLMIDIDEAHTIWLSAGLTHGIGAPGDEGSTEIAIHPRGAFDDPAGAPTPIATATVVEVEVDRSRLALMGDATLDPAQAYVGVITKLSAPQLLVMVAGTEPRTGAVRAALAERAGLFELTGAPKPGIPTIRIEVTDTTAQIHDATGAAIPHPTITLDDKAPAVLCAAVVNLAKWYGARYRTPPISNYNDVVHVELFTLEENEAVVPSDREPVPVVDGTANVTGIPSTGRRMRLSLRNTTMEPLYVVALDMSEAFGSAVIFANWIPEKGVGYAFDGEIKRLNIARWKGPNATTETKVLKVFAAKGPFDTTELQAPPLIPLPLGERSSGDPDIDFGEPDSPSWGTTTVVLTASR